MDRDFTIILQQLRDCGEQQALKNRDVSSRFKALGLAILFRTFGCSGHRFGSFGP
jgi:hypothetical protein